VVPADQLVETVWDDRPPRSAATTLRNYVMRLRKGLGRAGERIETRAGGYLITVGPGEFDADRLVALRDLGVDALRQGAFERATGLLDEALGLWRGPALVDVPSDSVRRVEADRLAEARLDILESKLDSELHLGHHAALFAELRTLTATHPERERFWVQLMTALYRSGRQSEALAVYQQVRQILTKEIGVEPGTELRAVHQRILSADPSLDDLAPVQDTEEHGIGRPVSLTPFQLPPDPTDFTGRTAEVLDLTARLTTTSRTSPLIAVVSGRPGVGKSALAGHVAHAARFGHPDGTLYADLRGTQREPASARAVLGSFLLSLGVPARAIPADLDERTALYRSVLAGRRLLVVLDNARDSAQVGPLLPSDPANASLITSRARLSDLAGAHPVELDAMTEDEALLFLERVLGPARPAADPRATAALVAACGGLPLALRVCAARLSARPSWTVRHLADRLAGERQLFDELSLGSLDVRASFAASYEALDPAAARAFRLLSLPNTATVRIETAARLLNEPLSHTERILERLVDAHLLDAEEPGRYRYDGLLRAFAREQSFLRGLEPERWHVPRRTARRLEPDGVLIC